MDTEALLKQHNQLVKPRYICTDIAGFERWLDSNGHDDEGYIEISSNETLSGHAEILEY